MLRWSAGAAAVTSGSGGCRPCDRLRLARQGRLVDAQRGRPRRGAGRRSRCRPARAARRPRARSRGPGRGGLAVADDPCLRARHALQGVHGLLCAVLLDEARRSPLNTTMARMMAVSLRSPRGAVMTAAASRTRIIALVNWSTSSRQAGSRRADELVGAVRDQAEPSLAGIEAPVRIGTEGGDDFRSVDRPWVPDAVDPRDVLDLDARGPADAWGHAHVDGLGSSHAAWSGRRRPVRSRASTPRRARQKCRSDRSATSAVPNQAIRPLVDDAEPP